jgi:molybdopterin molybdotransferase
MLSVNEALTLVLEHAQPLPPRKMLAAEALGCVLGEPVVSDIDSPPHDKSIVDGYAVQAATVTQAGAVLTIVEEVTAGALPTKSVEPGTATRIMTGAPIPAGADAVVMFEQTALQDENRVRIDAKAVKAGQNIMRRASSLTRGQTVLQPPAVLRGIELGILAEVGYQHALAIPRPKALVLATGNELVDFWEKPGPGQIRNSNSLLLWGLATQAGAYPGLGCVIRDDRESLRGTLAKSLNNALLIISGGVSAGVLDLVPQVLADLGVEQVFHKVNLKPGKPLWFGVKRFEGTEQKTLVFGLPGNPVSSLVCFELFVRPAIQKLSGREPTGLARGKARLTRDHSQRGERPAYWPADLQRGESPAVTPLPWKGSGDLATLAGANCLALFPAGERLFKAGEEVEVLHLPD